jgi:type II secretory pathway pseudopilin PulG
MNQNRIRHKPSFAGVTLIELTTVLVLISLLATLVVVNLNAGVQHDVTTQADILRRDLSHLQLLAIGQSSRLQLTVTTNSYAVCSASASSCDASSAIYDPSTGGSFYVSLATGVTFSDGIGNHYFDGLGRPATAASGSGLATAPMSFTLQGGSRASGVTVKVQPITGFASTTY